MDTLFATFDKQKGLVRNRQKSITNFLEDLSGPRSKDVRVINSRKSANPRHVSPAMKVFRRMQSLDVLFLLHLGAKFFRGPLTRFRDREIKTKKKKNRSTHPDLIATTNPVAGSVYSG